MHTLQTVPAALKDGPLRVAMLAPPWIAVPPAGYGGIEAVVDLLCEGLAARGHDVTLFAAPGSRSVAHMRAMLEAPHPDTIGSSLHESDHVASAFDAIDEAAKRGEPFDVVHDHSGFTALAMASRLSFPVVHTLHGPLVAETRPFYRRHAYKATLVAISHHQRDTAPAGVRIEAVVPNPIAVERWPLCTKKAGYLLWIGRMDPIKGAHRAIEAARIAGQPLVLAGPVQPGQADYFRTRIEPHIDGRRVRYVGEVTGAPKEQLYARAAALLMPIRWPEPFGMVMIEALACGTPVIAFAEGAATEIVIDGHNGMLVGDVAEMARVTDRLGSIDPTSCRESVRARYDIAITAAGYEALYRRATRRQSRREASIGRDTTPTTSRHGGPVLLAPRAPRPRRAEMTRHAATSARNNQAGTGHRVTATAFGGLTTGLAPASPTCGDGALPAPAANHDDLAQRRAPRASRADDVMSMTLEQIHTERPVTNTFHNISQCLSVKIDSAARYGLYADDAREDGTSACADMFGELAAQERAQIDRLLGCLRHHMQDVC